MDNTKEKLMDNTKEKLMDNTYAENSIDSNIIESKQFRKDLDEVLQRIKSSNRSSRERSISITKLQEAIMWLGMDLKALNETNPYPNSYNPSNTIVEPTADNLKL